MIKAWRGPIYGFVSKGQMRELADVVRPDVFLEGTGAHQNVRKAKAILEERGRRIENYRAVFIGVRDPYDMAVSRYFFMRRTYKWNREKPAFRMAHELGFEDFWLNSRGSNLSKTFLTLNGTPLKNQRFIRFESLEEDLSSIAEEFGFGPARLEHLNSTSHDHYSNYVKTSRCEAAIYRKFRYLFDSGLYPRRPIS